MTRPIFTIGGLFSGIGGLELGLERGLSAAGVPCSTIWQCEIEPFARAILRKHWPDAVHYDDVTTITEAPYVDLICGGFPCQDLSNAGLRRGITGARSGLFFELMRIVRMVRPRFVVLENVSALLGIHNGSAMGTVLGELASCGYDAEWDCIRASEVGAPHQRDRVFIVAYTSEGGQRLSPSDHLANATRSERSWWSDPCQSPLVPWNGPTQPPPSAVRVVDGVPARLDGHRIGACGNAVVPQVAEVIGRRVAQLMGGVE